MRDIAPFRAAAVGRHAAPVLSVYAGPMAVALDFDGVLVDSEPELSRVAWRTSCRLWPALTDECAIVDHLMDESAYVDRRRLGGQPLCGTGADGMPNWLEAKMRLLRPVIQSDADSLLLIRLCMEEALSPDARKRPLAVGEITENWGCCGENTENWGLRDVLLRRFKMSDCEAKNACEETRAAWIDEEPAEWASAHRQYPAVWSDVREAVRPSVMSKPELYILARPSKPRVQALLQANGVNVDDERILPVADAASKADALAALRERHAGATVRYVDDSVDDLRAVAADPRLLSVRTFYASYGYSTPAQEALVGAMPRVRTLASSRDLEGVLAMPRKDGMIM